MSRKIARKKAKSAPKAAVRDLSEAQKRRVPWDLMSKVYANKFSPSESRAGSVS